jgi:hypothetical protein
MMDRLGPDVPLHFTAFHPDWKLTDSPPTPPRTLRMARQIATDAGLHYVYTGNVHDPPPNHLLFRVRRGARRPRLVRHHGVASRCGRAMCHV